MNKYSYLFFKNKFFFFEKTNNFFFFIRFKLNTIDWLFLRSEFRFLGFQIELVSSKFLFKYKLFNKIFFITNKKKLLFFFPEILNISFLNIFPFYCTLNSFLFKEKLYYYKTINSIENINSCITFLLNYSKILIFFFFFFFFNIYVYFYYSFYFFFYLFYFYKLNFFFNLKFKYC